MTGGDERSESGTGMSQLVGFDGVDGHAYADQLVQGMRDTARWPATIALRAATRPLLEVPAGGAVLDVGCGLAEMVRVTKPGGHVVAIDTDWRTVAMAMPDMRLERMVARGGGVSEADAGAVAAAIVGEGRRGRFHLSLSMFAVTGRVA